MNKILKYLKKLKLPSFVFLFSFFGAYAGSNGTSLLWRRAFLPTITTVYAYIVIGMNCSWINALWVITIQSMWGALSMGYGIPDDDYPENPSSDDGSSLGNLFTILFREKFNRIKAHRYGDYFTRGTVGLLISLSLLSVPILKGNWIVYGLGSLGIILSQSLISWRGLGNKKVEVFGKMIEFQWSDVVNYAIIGLCVFAIITYKILGALNV